MKFPFFSLLILTIITPLQGEEVEEIAVLEELIATTQKNLEEQKILLELLHAYKHKKEAFVATPTSGTLAASLVRTSMQIQNILGSTPFSHLFSKKLKEEIGFFTLIGKEAQKEKGVHAITDKK